MHHDVEKATEPTNKEGPGRAAQEDLAVLDLGFPSPRFRRSSRSLFELLRRVGPQSHVRKPCIWESSFDSFL